MTIAGNGGHGVSATGIELRDSTVSGNGGASRRSQFDWTTWKVSRAGRPTAESMCSEKTLTSIGCMRTQIWISSRLNRVRASLNSTDST